MTMLLLVIIIHAIGDPKNDNLSDGTLSYIYRIEYEYITCRKTDIIDDMIAIHFMSIHFTELY